jgi:Raf kinase inhibitor-like YbhB/YbcL family protein
VIDPTEAVDCNEDKEVGSKEIQRSAAESATSAQPNSETIPGVILDDVTLVDFCARSWTMRKHLCMSLILTGAVLLIPFDSRSYSPGQITTRVSLESGHYELQGGRAMSFALKSTAFTTGGEIARRYTCDGADLSPELKWEDVPAGARSLALIADDPDAPMGTWTHWIIWNISAQDTALSEGVPNIEVLKNGALQGRNDFKRIGYGGPCPPPGKPHRYFFKLYALDSRLEVKAGVGRNELELAMKRHVVFQTQLMGTYRR